MEMLLQHVTRSPLMFMLDGFSGYNEVLVVEEDRTNKMFLTPQGTYTYVRIPFGLKMQVPCSKERWISLLKTSLGNSWMITNMI
jgi:hypothetical protein